MGERESTKARRNEILDAAMRCFLEKGYRNTTVDDVVRESSLSKGTLYWHFENKHAIFMALFERTMTEIIAMMPGTIDESAPVEERLRGILLSSTTLLTDEIRQFLTIPLGFMLELVQDETFMDRYKAIIGDFAAVVQGLIEEGIATGVFHEVDAYETAWAIMALYDGVMLYEMVSMPGDSLQQLAILTDTLIAGLRKA